MIDDQGIHPDTDKMDHIRKWRIPHNYNDIQCFVGLVNYVSNFLPNITAYTPIIHPVDYKFNEPIWATHPRLA